jgi:NADH-quinone oxidoreductase subunit C
MSAESTKEAPEPGPSVNSPVAAPAASPLSTHPQWAAVAATLGPEALFEISGKLPAFVLPSSALLESAKKLRAQGYDYLLFVTAVDYPAQNQFELVYALASYQGGEAFALICRIPRQDPIIPSVYRIWATAEWHEREVYDLFGIRFEDHPDLRRILLDDTWQGHPLRKDFVDQGHNVIKRPY